MSLNTQVRLASWLSLDSELSLHVDLQYDRSNCLFGDSGNLLTPAFQQSPDPS